MGETDAEKMARLPKWAQQRITVLEQNLARAHAKLNAGPDDSDTFADPYGEAQRPLGTGTRIDFVLRPGTGGSFHVNLVDGRLRVHGGDAVHVLPRAANAIEIELER